MDRTEIFPTSIYTEMIQLDNALLEQNILKWSSEGINDRKNTRKGWSSTQDMHLKSEYSAIVSSLIQNATNVFEQEYIERTPTLINMWANILYPGGHHNNHTHPNSHFSGVYYVKANNQSGNLLISDPRQGPQIIKNIRKEGYLVHKHLWETIDLIPKEGMLVLFPSWLPHSVDINNSNNNRISISFNFI